MLRIPNENGTDPAIVTVNALISRAVELGASDLHVAPGPRGGVARVRIGGALRPVAEFSYDVLLRVISRIKVLAGLDIADRRLPQDGRYDVEYSERHIDLRVSSLPTIDGERLSIRILDRDRGALSLEQLGMGVEILTRFRRMLLSIAGFVILCGPTGSGKTTTLYAALRERNLDAEHICSVEDPVELRVLGVAQVQVNARTGLTFPTVLRALLRQDPDVLVIGEMRDAQTAQIAVTAALCGRLVLTTLHTSSAISAFERLRELGVGSRMLASAVTGVLAQRLVGMRTGGQNCEDRKALFELLVMSHDVRNAVRTELPEDQLSVIAQRNGYRPMHERVA